MLKNDTKEPVKINPITNESWLQHFQDLWTQKEDTFLTGYGDINYIELAQNEECRCKF